MCGCSIRVIVDVDAIVLLEFSAQTYRCCVHIFVWSTYLEHPTLCGGNR